ncbi:hypothetical protein [Oleiagrimonas sp.]|jgi:hypothetical protein|uniref:hypothetical protein n=1 Tax=Oleiagrimonas sp. TaxID=2010330 RepID=UPI00260FBA3F|nr:hypothetical protein [Oleiagrimonas sp.]MDA3914864.1 hypothetical protein [Oleiagrimonas sp.]
MPTPPETVPADLSPGLRLRRAVAYPLRGASAAAVITLATAHAVVNIFPGIIIPWGGGAVIWVSILLYAMECLRRTAHGYADPPEVTLYSNYAPAISLLLLQALQLLALVLATHAMPLLWLVLLALVMLLPALAISLAFEDTLLAALNPKRWVTAMGVFGVAYLLPVTLGMMGDMAYLEHVRQTNWFAGSLWFVVVVYLWLLEFHVLGALMHRHHQRIGHTPEADVLADASGRDRDHELLEQVDRLLSMDQQAQAETLLRERLRERNVPLSVHSRYRRLMKARGDQQALLDHAQTQLTLLLAEDQQGPALGLVSECIEQDPQFMPGSPDMAARLADAAAARGMTRLAVRLARGYPNTWPRDPLAPRYGLLAARLMAERLDLRMEAGVLAHKLLRAYGQHPAHDEIQAFIETLDLRPTSGPGPS